MLARLWLDAENRPRAERCRVNRSTLKETKL